MNHHADFNVVLETVKQIFIEDLNLGNKSVTNDAEYVVEILLLESDERKTKEFVYKDSEGRWDVLEHDGQHFIGFAPYRGHLPAQL